jgi:hypothetical protein
MTKKIFTLTIISVHLFVFVFFADAQTLRLSLQERIPAEWDQNADSLVNRIEEWKPSETAMILCDMWEKHWCPAATKRFHKLANALNPVLDAARDQGILIVHAPSGCMNITTNLHNKKSCQLIKTPILRRR